MKEFFRLQRVPPIDLRAAPFPITQAFYRQFVLSPDYANPEHRRYLSTLIRRLIEMDRFLQLEAQAMLTEEGVHDMIRSFQRGRAGESFQPDFVDLYYLYSHIRAHRPTTVLELGSGVSTAVMAHALARNGQGHLYSIDASEDWARSTLECLPSTLARYASVQYRSPIEITLLGQDTYRFESFPVDFAEMIYIDGAAHENAFFQGAENLEFLDVRPGTCIYVDHRLRAVEFYFKKKLAGAVLGPNSAKWKGQMHSYMLVAKDFAAPLYALCGADLFSNTLVQVT